jgi:regulator of RNase E activity RraA
MTSSPDYRLVEGLRRIGTSLIGGVLDDLKIDGLMSGLLPIGRSSAFAGTAFTVRASVASRDTYPPAAFDIPAYIDSAVRGDVIVIDAGSLPVSLLGGIAVLVAKRRGVAGIVVHGGVRDGDEIASADLPVHVRHVVPVSGRTRIRIDGTQVPIVIDGCAIVPGDFIIGDGSGIVCIPYATGPAVFERSERNFRRDQLARAAVEGGAGFA